MKSPFKFLDSYTREDRAVFFGRDQEINELYRRVFEGKMLLVYGISGTGKSSLVNCGLASRFDESDWLPVNVRRGNNIVDSLSDAFNKQALTPLKKNQKISEKLQSIYLDHFKPVYLLFDQFEELFIFGSQEEKEGFISIVKEITESETQCRIIFIIREEFLAGMTEFEEKLPDIFTNRFRVEKMKRTNAISAVEGPCKVFGIEIESEFSEELINKLCPAGNEIELTYLQIYLDRIFRLALNEEPATSNEQPATVNIKFSIDLLAKAGSVSDLLGQFLDEQIRDMEDPETGMAILKSFVSIQGTKRQMAPSEILETLRTLGTEINESDLIKYLNRFVDLRILRERDEAGHFELRHDSLASKVFEKFTALEKDIIEVRQFIENAWHDWMKRSVLLSSDDLDYLAPYESKLYFSKECSGLIEKSKNALFRTKQRRRNIAIGAAVILLIVLVGFTGWALIEKNKTKKQEIIAKANYFSSLSKEFAISDPTKALWLAEYATSLNPTAENRHNLVNIYSGNDFYDVFMSTMQKNLETSYKFRYLPKSGEVAINKEGRIFISDRYGKISNIITFDNSKSLLSFEISPDERHLLARFNDDTVGLFDMSGKLLLKVNSPVEKFFYDYDIPSDLFFPDSKSFLTISLSKEISVWSVNGELIARSDKFDHNTDAIITSTSDKLLLCSAHGILYTWDLSKNTISRTKLQLNDSTYVRNPPVITSDYKIAVFRSDKKLCIYDTTGKCGNSWKIDYFPKKVISDLDKSLIITYNESVLDLWDYYGKNVKRLKCNTTISDVQFDPIRSQVLFSTQNRIMAIHIENPKDSLVLKTRNYVIFNNNNNNLIELQKDKKQVSLYDQNGNLQKIIRLNGDCEDPCLSVTGNFIAFQNSSKPYLTITDLRNGSFLNMDSMDIRPSFISFSGTDKYIATSGKTWTDPKYNGVIFSASDVYVNLWTKEGKFIRTINCGAEVKSIHFSADDKFILASSGCNAFSWDIAGQKTCTFTGHAGVISCIDISNDGQYVLTGAFDGTTRLWSADGKTIKVIQTHEMNFPIDVSFINDKSSFMAYNQNKIQIYNFGGELLQIIPFRTFSNLPLTCYFSSADSAVLYSDPEKGGLVKMKLKIPVDTFITSGNHKDLSINDKIMYGIVSVKDLLLSRNYDDLYFAGVYLMYWKTRGVLDLDELKTMLRDAEKLFRRGLKFDPAPERIYEKLTEIYLQRNQLFDENTKRDVDKLYRAIITLKNNFEMFEAANFYYDNFDKTPSLFGFDEKVLALYKKILSQNSDYLRLIGTKCSDMSWSLLERKSFKTALDAALTSIKADSTNPYIYTNLPLAYIFNDQYSYAEKIYNEWKDKSWTASGEFKTFKEAFIVDLVTFEKAGITHPDFEKVKELLNK